MAQKEMAFVVVEKSWFDCAMDPLVVGRPSQSTGDTHIVLAELDDLTDSHGLWLRGIDSKRFAKAKDGSSVVMRLMIPWHVVLAVGVVDESVKCPVGFTNVTDLRT